MSSAAGEAVSPVKLALFAAGVIALAETHTIHQTHMWSWRTILRVCSQANRARTNQTSPVSTFNFMGHRPTRPALPSAKHSHPNAYPCPCLPTMFFASFSFIFVIRSSIMGGRIHHQCT